MFGETIAAIPTYDANLEALWMSAPSTIKTGRRSIH